MSGNKQESFTGKFRSIIIIQQQQQRQQQPELVFYCAVKYSLPNHCYWHVMADDGLLGGEKESWFRNFSIIERRPEITAVAN